MGLGLLFGALSGAGGAVADIGAQSQKVNDERALMQERSALEEQRQMRLDEIKRTRDRDYGVKQGKDIDTEVAAMRNKRDAEAINAKNGSSMTAEDAQVLRSNPEARKAYGLLNTNRMDDLRDRGDSAQKLGYLDEAKQVRGDLQSEIANERNTKNDATANRRADILQEYQVRRENRMDRLAEVQERRLAASDARQNSRDDNSATKEQRAATAKALDGVNADIKALEKEAADSGMADDVKAVVRRQLTNARAEAERYRNALADAGLKGSEAPAPSITEAAIAKLRANPDRAGDFDSLFGKGSSGKYLKQAPATSTKPALHASFKPAEKAPEKVAAQQAAGVERVSMGRTTKYKTTSGKYYDSAEEASAALDRDNANAKRWNK